jgi:hypothetical protein
MIVDEYKLYDIRGNNVTLNQTGIANKAEKSSFFKRYSDNRTQWMDVENEHFIVWMAMETFNSFRKLWARIDTDLQPGMYNLMIQDSIFLKIKYIFLEYNVSQYNATKGVVITTSNPLGSGPFYGWALIIGAVYCFVVVLIMWVILIAKKENKFDINALKWK